MKKILLVPGAEKRRSFFFYSGLGGLRKYLAAPFQLRAGIRICLHRDNSTGRPGKITPGKKAASG